MGTEELHRLEYGPRPAWHRRRWGRRTIALGVVLAVVGGMGMLWMLWGPGVWRQAKVVYWQRRCMTYAAPAAQVVYDSGTPRGGVAPGCLVELERAMGGGGGPRRVVFLHSRKTAGVVERLVVVGVTGSGSINAVGLLGVATQPAVLVAEAQWSHSSYIDGRLRGWDVKWNGPPRLLLYAGQPDPRDESHFTIVYVENGQRGTIDGLLKDAREGVVVRLQARDGPAESSWTEVEFR